jgi:hypothetical protein
MRLPRIRFTIGRLMVLVLLASVVSWGLFFVPPRLIKQSVFEQQAEASYKQARLVREVAEYADKEYEQGLYLWDMAKPHGQIALTQSDVRRAIDRLDRFDRDAFLRLLRRVDPIRPPGSGLGKTEEAEQARALLDLLDQYQREKQIEPLKRDVETAKAAELAKLQALEIERARRWRWAFLGF